MKIFENVHGLHGHGFEVGQCLHRIGGVVHGRLWSCPGISTCRRQDGPGQSISFAVAVRNWHARLHCRLRHGNAAAGSNQAIGDGPFVNRQSQVGAGGAHQRDSAHFLHRFHDNDGSRRIDKNFQSFQRIDIWPIHIYLTRCDLLP